ncbi:MAG TPA: helix-turn-helix transcriptional regulator [Streptosporangiaceae bacterium]|jgi:transcriptional regulator with XRE-family HTH domain
MPTFNHRMLRTWRLESGLRAEEVCYRARMSASYLRTLEDRGGNPSASVLGRIAAVYGRSLDELFTFDSDSDPAGAR